MSDTLLGVLIGGAIASVVPIISLFLNISKWKREKRIDFLYNKRKQYSDLFSSLMDEMIRNEVKQFNYSMDLLTSFIHLVPKEVSDSFSYFFEKYHTVKEEDKRRFFKDNYMKIWNSMKKELAEIDKKIEKEIL